MFEMDEVIFSTHWIFSLAGSNMDGSSASLEPSANVVRPFDVAD